MKKILVTALGSFSSGCTLNHLKSNNYYIVGTGVHDQKLVAESVLTDRYYKVPYAVDSEAFLNAMYKICEKEKINYLLPLTDSEVDVLNANRKWFEEHDVILCFSEEDVINLCRNKMKITQLLSEVEGVNIIPTSYIKDISDGDVILPVVCKEVDGRSSQNLNYISTKEDWMKYKEMIEKENMIVQPYVEGIVVTADVIRQFDGKYCVVIPRKELVRTHNGAGLSVQIFIDEKLTDLCILIADKLNVTGCVNFEFIMDSEGHYHFLECNPRFSGGIAFSCMTGYDCILNHLRCFDKESIDRYTLGKEYYIARKYEEYITAELE